ncbi:transient receptor potential cation channel subfamily M member 2-like isoform X2 [Sycon ciliatum]|uniref:transient receptor potential cation channel subfamily M member 2-like isoform X2 n=1 Tax=Sycon ciliatum TaxID=27933 RepID=UPI0031F70E49
MKQRDSQAKRRCSQWYEQNLKKRECKTFISNTGIRTSLSCQCGLKRTDHVAGYETANHRNMTWLPHEHTREVPTDAAGFVQFTGEASSAPSSTSYYARVSASTSDAVLLDLLLNRWQLPQPDIIISVTGGARTNDLSEDMRNRFRKGLVKVGMASNAWLVSGGTNTGVMKLVGDVVQEHTVHRAKSHASSRNLCAIGFATWGTLEDRESLVQQPLSAYPVRYTASSSRALNPHHTHFLLVDNGSTGSYGVEIQLRARLEKAMSKCRLEGANGNASKISVVVLAVEGGPNTLRTIRQAVSKGLPAVLIQGTGRATDLLIHAYNNSCQVSGRNGIFQQVPPKLLPELREKISSAFRLSGIGSREKQLHRCEAEIQECLKNKDMLHIVNLMGGEEEDHLDYAILKALLTVNAGSAVEQLHMALTWNRPDFAEKEVFDKIPAWRPGLLDSVLMRALVEGKVEFVKLLIQSKAVCLEKFAKQDTVLSLYNSFSSVVTLRVMFLNYNKTPGSEMSLRDLTQIIARLVGYDFSLWYELHPEESQPMPAPGRNRPDGLVNLGESMLGPMYDDSIDSDLLRSGDIATALRGDIATALRRADSGKPENPINPLSANREAKNMLVNHPSTDTSRPTTTHPAQGKRLSIDDQARVVVKHGNLPARVSTPGGLSVVSGHIESLSSDRLPPLGATGGRLPPVGRAAERLPTINVKGTPLTGAAPDHKGSPQTRPAPNPMGNPLTGSLNSSGEGIPLTRPVPSHDKVSSLSAPVSGHRASALAGQSVRSSKTSSTGLAAGVGREHSTSGTGLAMGHERRISGAGVSAGKQLPKPKKPSRKFSSVVRLAHANSVMSRADTITDEYLNEACFSDYDEVDAVCNMSDRPTDTVEASEQWKETWKTSCNHLFLWSIITGQKCVSEVLWPYTSEPMAAALMACKLLRTLAELLAKEQTYDEEKNELMASAERFEALAMGVLTECNRRDDFSAQRVVRRILPFWGSTTCLALADGSDSQRFVSHNACQALLNKVWMGRLQAQNTSLSICLCVLVPAFIPFALSYAQYSKEDTERLSNDDAGVDDNASLAPSLNELAFIRPLSPTQQEMFNREEHLEGVSIQRTVVQGLLSLQDMARRHIPTLESTTPPAHRATDNPMIIKEEDCEDGISGSPPPPTGHGIDVPDTGKKRAVSVLIDEPVDGNTDGDSDQVYKLNTATKKAPARKYYKLGISQRFMAFYSAPVVKFWIALLSYLMFLALFSVMLLSRWDTCSPKPIELMVLLYIASLASIEARQISQDPAPYWSDKLGAYFGSLWNWLDVGSLTLYLVHLPLRYSCPSELDCMAGVLTQACNATLAVVGDAKHIYPLELRLARIFCSTSCLLFFLRLLQIFTVNSDLGPKIHMILRMILDVMEFALIFLIFVVSFGVTSQAMLYPTEDLSWRTLQEVLYRPYWQIYGEFFLETVAEGGEMCGVDGQRACPKKEFLPILFLAVYALMSNILLIDLLSAVFNNTYEEVQGQAVQIWKFNRYSLVMEYLSRSRWPPPFSVVSQIILSLAHCVGVGISLWGDLSELAEVVEDAGDVQQLQEFEHSALQSFLNSKTEQQEEESQSEGKQVQSSATELLERMTRLEATIQQLCTAIQTQDDAGHGPASVSRPRLGPAGPAADELHSLAGRL